MTRVECHQTVDQEVELLRLSLAILVHLLLYRRQSRLSSTSCGEAQAAHVITTTSCELAAVEEEGGSKFASQEHSSNAGASSSVNPRSLRRRTVQIEDEDEEEEDEGRTIVDTRPQQVNRERVHRMATSKIVDSDEEEL